MPNSPRRAGNTKLTNTRGFERSLGVIFATDPSALNALLVNMPLFLWSLRDETWPTVESLIVAAKDATLITTDQYNAIREAAVTNNVPITLP